MLDKTATKFSHVKPADTPWRTEGLRDFFLYKDLGVSDATSGKFIAHLVKASMAPETGTGWHRLEAEFQIVHYLYDYSPDMEHLEIVGPADFKSIDVPPLCMVPAPEPWK